MRLPESLTRSCLKASRTKPRQSSHRTLILGSRLSPLLTLDESQILQQALLKHICLVKVGFGVKLKVPVLCDFVLPIRKSPEVEMNVIQGVERRGDLLKVVIQHLEIPAAPP